MILSLQPPIRFHASLRLRITLAAAVFLSGLPRSPGADSKTAIYSQDAVISHLNETIHWFRQVQASRQSVTQPSDQFFWEIQSQLAAKAVKAAFDSAAAQVPLTQAPPAPAAPARGAVSGATQAAQANRPRLRAGVSERLATLGAQIKAVDAQLQAVKDEHERAALTSQRHTLEAALNLSRELQSAIQKVETYMTSASESDTASSLSGQITALQLSLPEAFGSATPSTAAATAPAETTEGGGLIGRTATLFKLIAAQREIDRLISETTKMQSLSAKLRDPLRLALSGILEQSQQLSDRALANDPSQWATVQQQLESLAASFTLLSAPNAPLRGESIFLDQSLDNLRRWQDSVNTQFVNVRKGLLERIFAVAGALALVMVFSEIWRRVTFRYVEDARRRHQFLLVRRVVVGALFVIVIVMGVISGFGSLVTFAGFTTAGIALALQSIILSLAAYFFLSGRYGVRVGDRITISGVTGEVVDMGFVRMHLSELVQTGSVLHPTGRVVVVPNSVIFQANPMFKQMPGTEFGWHEVAVTLKADGNLKHARDNVLAAVNAVYAEYKELIEGQHGKAEKLVGVKLRAPSPAAQLRIVEGGLEVLVRYPVPIGKEAEVDELVAGAVLDAIHRDPALSGTVISTPRTGRLQATG